MRQTEPITGDTDHEISTRILHEILPENYLTDVSHFHRHIPGVGN